MSDDTLDKINEVLAANPACGKQCGDKTTTLHREDDKLVAEVRFTGSARASRFEVAVSDLDASSMGTDVAPEHGRGQVFIPCRNSGACRWLIRDDPHGEWHHARDDPELAIDLAPDDAAANEVKLLLQRWLQAP